MKIEDQVCSLELAKRLKELGVKQESLFYWKEHIKSCNRGEYIACENFAENEGDDGKWKITPYSAFTVAELLNILPAEIGNPHLEIVKFRDGSYGCEYLCLEGAHSKGDTLANACAKMLIHLIDNKLLDLSI